MSDSQRKIWQNRSQVAQGITAGCFKIVAMRKVDYPDLVTIPDSSVVMTWTSFEDVRAYFGWEDKRVVAKLLATEQARPILHLGGVQLRYTLDGTTPTRDFNDPRKYIIRNRL